MAAQTQSNHMIMHSQMKSFSKSVQQTSASKHCFKSRIFKLFLMSGPHFYFYLTVALKRVLEGKNVDFAFGFRIKGWSFFEFMILFNQLRLLRFRTSDYLPHRNRFHNHNPLLSLRLNSYHIGWRSKWLQLHYCQDLHPCFDFVCVSFSPLRSSHNWLSLSRHVSLTIVIHSG